MGLTNMEKTNLEICIYKIIAERQRENELKEYKTDIGCTGYYRTGCFSCDGLNKKCETYIKQR